MVLFTEHVETNTGVEMRLFYRPLYHNIGLTTSTIVVTGSGAGELCDCDDTAETVANASGTMH